MEGGRQREKGSSEREVRDHATGRLGAPRDELVDVAAHAVGGGRREVRLAAQHRARVRQQRAVAQRCAELGGGARLRAGAHAVSVGRVPWREHGHML